MPSAPATPRIRAAVLACALAGLAAGAAPAAAVQVLAPAGRAYDPFALDAAAAPGGAAVAAWTVRGSRNTVEAAVRPAGASRFGARVALGPGRVARAAVAPDGAATVTWLDGAALRAARVARGGWRADRLPDALPTRGLRVAGLTALPGGRAVLALESRSAEGWTVVVLRRGPGGRWRRSAADLSVPDTSAGRAAVDGSGRVTAAWLATRRGKPQSALLVADLGAGGGGWSAGAVVATAGDGELFAEPELAVDTRGGTAVLVGALDAAGGPAGGRVAVRPAGGASWRLSAPTRAASITLTPGGVVWGAWLAGAGDRTRPMVARLADDGWDGPVAAGPAGPVIGGPAAASDTAGRPVVWWLLRGGRAGDRWRTSGRGGHGWSSPASLGRTSGAIAVSTADGRGLAVWVDAGADGRVTAGRLR
ncbi:MAG: hypothetical protein IT200_11585 [Thermoleophilia bacterium]|nr:hypothetical protein [Thermoleophilia bacterium]